MGREKRSWTSADVLVERLIDWKVSVVFGLPGDGINGYMEALRRRQDRVRFVQVRHEESAAFMACGYAKFSGRIGVCLATSGPGAIHLLNGLYDARLDGAPVLAITGQTYHDLGTSFPYMEFYPKHDQARAVQIDRDPTRIGLRFPVEVGLAGDARATLGALLPLLERRRDGAFLETAQSRMSEWREHLHQRATRTDLPMKPQVVAHHLGELLEGDAIIATDSGTVTSWIARHLSIRRGQQFSCSGNLATMACGLPYAIAAQIAFPDRQCVAFVGDGAFSILMAELATAVKYQLPLTVVVVKNDTLGMIKWEQMVFLGNPEYGCELQPIDFVQFAHSCGAVGLRCEDPATARGILAEALATARGRSCPVLVEAVVDPFEPPEPPRVKLEQVLHMAQALAKGEPNRGRIALTLFRNKVRDLF